MYFFLSVVTNRFDLSTPYMNIVPRSIVSRTEARVIFCGLAFCRHSIAFRSSIVEFSTLKSLALRNINSSFETKLFQRSTCISTYEREILHVHLCLDLQFRLEMMPSSSEDTPFLRSCTPSDVLKSYQTHPEAFEQTFSIQDQTS